MAEVINRIKLRRDGKTDLINRILNGRERTERPLHRLSLLIYRLQNYTVIQKKDRSCRSSAY